MANADERARGAAAANLDAAAPHARGDRLDLHGEDEDDGVPPGLVMAAVEEFADQALAGAAMDSGIVQRSLLRFVSDADLEETVLRQEEVVAQAGKEMKKAASDARGDEHKRSFHVFYDGAWRQWSELVRAFDGFTTVTDRGRAARFWNVMASHYQSRGAHSAARACAAAAATAAAEDEDVEDVEVDGAVVNGLDSVLRSGSIAAVWLVGATEEDPGRMELIRVRGLFARGPKAGYRMKQEVDISTKDAGWLKGDLLAFDQGTGKLQLRTEGVRFIKISSNDVIQPVRVAPTGIPGVLELDADQRRVLADREPELRATAIAAMRERAVAKEKVKAAADEAKRLAGRKDMSVLTVELIKEELRLRRARGETIDRLGANKAEALEILAAARSAAPSVPTLPPVAAPAPAVAPAPAAAPAAAADAPASTSATIDHAASATGGGARAALVGRRVMATYLDQYGETQWYPATIVQHRPRATKYHFVVHYDEGEEILVGLPDDSVRLMEARVSHCKCARCCLSGPEGLKL